MKLIPLILILTSLAAAQQWEPTAEDRKHYTPEQIEHLKCSFERRADPIHGVGKHRPRFLGIFPHGKREFMRRMDPDDTSGSVLQCFHDVHRRGDGYCEIPPCSLKPGRTRILTNKKTPNVHLRLAESSSLTWPTPE